jgi:Uma2 family endonuclease
MSAVTTPPPQPAAPSSAAGPRPFRWTREAYYKLAELGFFNGRRVQRIRGEIIEMSPPGWPHVAAKSKTADVLRRVFAGVGWVNEQAPLPTSDSDPEPDVAVYPGQIRDYTDHPTNPLLVVEVADDSLFYDTTTKAEVYAAAGFADYWVIDLPNRRLLVFRDPSPVAAVGTAYRTHLTLGPADSVAPLAAPQAAIPVADLLP